MLNYLKYKHLFGRDKKPRRLRVLNLDKQTLFELAKLKKSGKKNARSTLALGHYLSRTMVLHNVKDNIVSFKNTLGNIWSAYLQVLDKNGKWIKSDTLHPNDTVGCNGYLVLVK